MKRLLLVAYHFPPAAAAGAVRPGYLSRYLPECGWDVRVLTLPRSDSPSQQLSRRPVVDSPLIAALRNFRWQIKETLLFPDTTAPWIPGALKTGFRMLENEHFDAILSTAHPPSVHVVGWMLARRSGLPWIADYRDPWAGNAYLRRGPLRTAMERLLERAMIGRAQRITTISQPVAGQIAEFHRRDVAVIPNAYDPADWDDVPDTHPARFDLCFTGSMYDGKRSPDLLFEAVARLRSSGDPAGTSARMHFYGPNSSNVDASASRYGVTLQVRRHGVVPRLQAMRAQRSAAALLIFLNMDPATAKEMGSKYLEYVGARRPIIAFGPAESVMRGFLEQHGLGWFASTPVEAEHALRAAYAQFQSGAFDVAGDARDIPTARQMSARFADLLESVSAKSATPRTA